MPPFAGPRISRPIVLGDNDDGTNTSCHGSTVPVTGHSKRVMDDPRVILILWDSLFVNNATAVATAQQLVNDLISSAYMNGLAQYGVARGSLIDTVILDTKTYPAPTTWDSSQAGTADFNQLKTWFADTPNSKLTAPAQDETQLVYLIVLPNTTRLTNGKNSDGTPNNSVVGWHYHAKFNAKSTNDDTFWALVETIGYNLVAGQEQPFINGFAFGVAHELIETFTDPDGNGYFSDVTVSPTQIIGCEIGDICELGRFIYKAWKVEPYWSAWDNACIQGDAPVSLSRFFAAINFDSRTKTLSALGTNVINLDYVAARMR